MPRKTRASWGSNKPARRKGYRTLRYWADLHDGRGYMRHTMTVEGSKRDGDRELARIRLAHEEDVRVPTFRECVEQWYLPGIENLSFNTRKAYMSALNSKILPRWGDVPITDIRPMEMQEWLSGMTKTQAATAMKIMGVALDYPTRYEVIPSNPARVKYRMPTAVTRRDKGTYTLGEALRILDACHGSFAESAVITSLFGSCRVGESLGVMVGEVVECAASNGLTAAHFCVSRQVNNTGNIVDTLKTEQSERPIVLVGKVAERMLEIQDERRADGLLWLTDNGACEHVTQRVMTDEWRRITASAGLQFHPYRNLRNSWRTFMEWELHVDAAKLEFLMGHKGQDVTSIYYNRPTVQMLIDEVAKAFADKGVLI